MPASIRRRPLHWVIVALVEALNGIAIEGLSSRSLRPRAHWARGCRSLTRPTPESDRRSCDILCTAMAVYRGTSNPSRLPGRLLLIRRGFGCLALGFAQRSLLLLFSLFFLGACACCPLSLGPVSTVIRLECHWLPPCAAG